MKTVYLSKNAKNLYDKFVMMEGAEVKSLDLASDYIFKNWASSFGFNSKDEAKAYLRTTFRENCGAFHNNKEGKFFLGAVRLLENGKKYQNGFFVIGKLVKILANDEEMYKSNDINLSKFDNFNDVLKFMKNFENENEKEMNESAKNVFKNIKEYYSGGYTIVPIRRYKDAVRYSEYTDWCICSSRNHFNGYTQDGEIHLYFVLRDGYEQYETQEKYFDSVRDRYEMNNNDDDGYYDSKFLFGEDFCSWDDEYALSMLAVFVNSDNEVTMCVSRYNHECEYVPNDLNGYSSRDFEHYFTKKELSYILGGNFDNLMPYTQESYLSSSDKALVKYISTNCEGFLENKDIGEAEFNDYKCKMERFNSNILCNCTDGDTLNVSLSFIVTDNDSGYGKTVKKEHIYDFEIESVGNTIIIPHSDSSGFVESTLLNDELKVIYDNVKCNSQYARKGLDGNSYMPIEFKKCDRYGNFKNIFNATTHKIEFDDHNISKIKTCGKDISSECDAMFVVNEYHNDGERMYLASKHKFIESKGVYEICSTIMIDEENKLFSLIDGENIGLVCADIHDIRKDPGYNEPLAFKSFCVIKDENGLGLCDSKGKILIKCGEIENIVSITNINMGSISIVNIKMKGYYGIFLSSNSHRIESVNSFVMKSKNGFKKFLSKLYIGDNGDYYNLGIAKSAYDEDYFNVMKDKNGKEKKFKDYRYVEGTNQGRVYLLTMSGEIYLFKDFTGKYIITEDKWEDIVKMSGSYK